MHWITQLDNAWQHCKLAWQYCVQVLSLAVDVGSSTSDQGAKEALDLVACTQREAVSSGWGTDLPMFLADVSSLFHRHT